MGIINTMSVDHDNPIFRAYVFYGSVLVLKLLFMVLLTARQRFSKHVFMNPEDRLRSGDKVKYDDPDIERVRRAHLNDLENIPAFLVAAWFYMMTNPSSIIAINLMRIFTIARITHTFVYYFAIPQPTRFLAFVIGYLITGYMAFQGMLHYAS